MFDHESQLYYFSEKSQAERVDFMWEVASNPELFDSLYGSDFLPYSKLISLLQLPGTTESEKNDDADDHEEYVRQGSNGFDEVAEDYYPEDEDDFLFEEDSEEVPGSGHEEDVGRFFASALKTQDLIDIVLPICDYEGFCQDLFGGVLDSQKQSSLPKRIAKTDPIWWMSGDRSRYGCMYIGGIGRV